MRILSACLVCALAVSAVLAAITYTSGPSSEYEYTSGGSDSENTTGMSTTGRPDDSGSYQLPGGGVSTALPRATGAEDDLALELLTDPFLQASVMKTRNGNDFELTIPNRARGESVAALFPAIPQFRQTVDGAIFSAKFPGQKAKLDVLVLSQAAQLALNKNLSADQNYNAYITSKLGKLVSDPNIIADAARAGHDDRYKKTFNVTLPNGKRAQVHLLVFANNMAHPEFPGSTMTVPVAVAVLVAEDGSKVDADKYLDQIGIR